MTRVNVVTIDNEVAVWVADNCGIVQLSSADGRWLRLLLKAFLELKLQRLFGKKKFLNNHNQ